MARKDVAMMQIVRFRDGRSSTIGTEVLYYPVLGDAHGSERTRTVSEPEILGGHTAVVWVEGHAACVALRNLEVIS